MLNLRFLIFTLHEKGASKSSFFSFNVGFWFFAYRSGLEKLTIATVFSK